jgi:hypothetical protein
MASKKKNKNKPKEGWVVELKEAERGVKMANNQATPEQHLRVARAARKLRIWSKSNAAAEKGLSIDRHGPLRAQLVECQKQADAELSVPSMADHYEIILPKGIECLNASHCAHDIFSNLNVLQFATMNGDARLLEDLVASGAALDHPVLCASNNNCHFPDAEPAPKGSTALVLCCAYLAMETWLVKRGHPTSMLYDDEASGLVECAILLVKLGADFHRKFILDPSSEVCGPTLSWYRPARLSDKTALQLAQMAQQPELVKIMEELQSNEKRIALVYCRCGSRLPWKECHAGNTVGESPIYREKGGRLVWRYSPLARCLCGYTKKTHYECCWKESPEPHYMDDYDGIKTVAFHTMTNRIIAKAKRGVAEMGRASTITLDTTKRFKWTPLHWGVPKAELLYMVKKWNIGLRKFCDVKELTGSDREHVIENNCATPYALCGSGSCPNIETKVKEFRKCSKCKTIAYCSSECQRKGWKAHKKSCHAN